MFSKESTDELHVRTGYFDRVMEDPDGIIAEAREALQDVEFDSFVVTGLSGASVAALLAYHLNKTYLILRKPDDLSTHSSRRAVGRLGKRWVFLDDFICSGDTRLRVMSQLAELLRREAMNGGHYDHETDEWVEGDEFPAEYVGDYLYQAGMSGPGRFERAEDMDQSEWLTAKEEAIEIVKKAWV